MWHYHTIHHTTPDCRSLEPHMKKVLLHLLCLVLAFATRPRYAYKYGVDTINPRTDSTKQYRQETTHLIERGSRYNKRHDDRYNREKNVDLLTKNYSARDSDRIIEDRLRSEVKDEHLDRYAINKSYPNESQKESRRWEVENRRTDCKNREIRDFPSEWYRLKNCKCLTDEITSDARPHKLSERQERRTHDYEAGEISQSNFRRKYYDTLNQRDVRSEKRRSNVKEAFAALREGQKEDAISAIARDAHAKRFKIGSRRTITIHITSRPKVKNTLFDHRRTQVSRLREMPKEEGALAASHEINEISTHKSEYNNGLENNHKNLLKTLSGALTKLGHEVKKLSDKVVVHEKALEQHEKRLNVLESNIAQEMDKMKKRAITKTTKITSETTSNCKPPPFDGTTSFSGYIDQFEALGYENGWSKERALTTLISALRDKALEVLDSIGDDFTYEELVDALSKKFTIDSAEASSRHKTFKDEIFSEDEAPSEVIVEPYEDNINLRSKEIHSEPEDRRDEADDRSIGERLEFQTKYERRPSSDIEDRSDGSERDKFKVINVEMELLKKSEPIGVGHSFK